LTGAPGAAAGDYSKPAQPSKKIDLNQMGANGFMDNPSRKITFVTINCSTRMLFLTDPAALWLTA
jgi:hypothetical protein